MRTQSSAYPPVLTGILLDVPTMPTPIRALDRVYLLYELHITSLRSDTIELNHIDVVADPAKSPLQFRYDSAYLDQWLRRTGPSEGQSDKRRIGAGSHAVLFLNIPLESSRVPLRLHHQLAFKDEKQQPITEEGASVVIRQEKPRVLHPPLRGDKWVALNSLGNQSHHRTWWIPYRGKAILPQRYAIDWIQLGPENRPFHDDPRENKNYYGYGAEVLAIADARVVSTREDRRDNVPFTTDKASVQPDDAVGNYVVLDIGKGYFAVCAHLQPGSIRVKTGQHLRAGHVLGKLGNSGSADFPHLHFHLLDANSPILADGAPYVLSDFVIQGRAQSLDALMEGKGFEELSPSKVSKRVQELPLDNMVARLGGPRQ